ncbi:hypothetical protein DYH09_10000 [bacterium CPR1]|nr:hypothetical protein [bacterium CPR1]
MLVTRALLTAPLRATTPGAPAPASPEEPAERVTLGNHSVARVGMPALSPQPAARTWQDEIFYMVMTDRFHNGDKTNDQGSQPQDHQRFHGGDFQGIIDKLDYLQDVGVTTLWISPVHQQKRDFFGMDGYHGYWPTDFFQIEQSFGDMAKLKELVARAHDKGLKVVVDMVFNHLGYDAPLAKDPDKQEWFHHGGNARIPTQRGLEQGEFCGLPDFAQENPEVSRYLIDMAKWLIDETGIDGMRLDAVRHVPKDFWKQFSSEIHAHTGNDFLLLGEIYHPKPKATQVYQNEAALDTVFDFPLNFALRDTIGYNEDTTYLDNLSFFMSNILTHPGESFRMVRGKDDGDMRRLSDIFAQDGVYRRPDLLVTMLDNHDNRKDMEFAGKKDVTDHFRTLAHLRHDSLALRRGYQKEVLADREVYAYARLHPKDSVVVALNNATEVSRRELRMPSEVKEGTRFEDALTGQVVTVKDGQVAVEIPARQAVVLRAFH